MYKYFFLTWLIVLFASAAMAQQPDTTSKAAIKASSRDTLKSTRHDTIVTREFKPKIKKEKVYHPDSTHSPHTAVMRSLLVPGLGQIYNHSWWKVPVIYAGIGLLADAIIYNNTNYNLFLTLSKYREFGTPPTPGQKDYAQAVLYSQQPDQALYDATDGYRRNRDLSILGVVGAWGINVIDAYIDAKFIHSYSVDNDLSFRIDPGLINQPLFAQTSTSSLIPGIKITFTF
jgi:hypothetical protein